jgi:hypothetical protein
MDIDGYPDDEELDCIRVWPPGQTGDFASLLEYVHERWAYARNGYWSRQGSLYRLATGGWSGNEDLIRAMRENRFFWGACRVASISGGLYLFSANTGIAGARPESDLLRALRAAIDAQFAPSR